MNKNTKWVKIKLGTVFVVLGLIAFVNYYVDPFWNFTHKNRFNTKQKQTNERVQKTNFVVANGLKKYNNLLVGSSRSTYLNQTIFTDPTFNLAFNGAIHLEYYDYIEFAKKHKGKEFDKIYMGLLFASTEKNIKIALKPPKHYIQNAQNPLKKYKELLSFDALNISRKNIKLSLGKRKGDEYYDRDLVKYRDETTNLAKLKHDKKIDTKNHIQRYKNHKYRQNYKKELQKIINANKKTKIIPYIMPTSKSVLNAEAFDNCRFKAQYIRWLHEVIELFGGFYAFVHIPYYTKESHYFDSNHGYPKYSTQTIIQIQKHQKGQKSEPVYITKTNLDEFLKKTKTAANQECKKIEAKK